jgi:hypothetical protein
MRSNRKTHGKRSLPNILSLRSKGDLASASARMLKTLVADQGHIDSPSGSRSLESPRESWGEFFPFLLFRSSRAFFIYQKADGQ